MLNSIYNINSISDNGIVNEVPDIELQDPSFDKNGDPLEDEMRLLYKRNAKYDNKRTVDIIRSAAKVTGVNPYLLFSSSWGEGMNKAIARPDEVSEAYNIAGKKDKAVFDYPVDGFYNYGLDTFGQRYEQLKKYLPKGFENRFKTYKAYNDKTKVVDGKVVPAPELVTTAAFKTNEDALIAKSAMLRDEMDKVNRYAAKEKIDLDENAVLYFTMASYNSGFGNAKTMLDEYAKSEDKTGFIENGETTRKGVHKNISPRMKHLKLAKELMDLDEQEQLQATQKNNVQNNNNL